MPRLQRTYVVLLHFIVAAYVCFAYVVHGALEIGFSKILCPSYRARLLDWDWVFCIPSLHRLEGILAEPIFYGNVCWSGVRAGAVHRVPVVPVCDDALTEAQPFDGYLVSCTIAFRRK